MIKEYNSRYAKRKLRRILTSYNNRFKRWLLITISNNKWLVKKYRIFDHHTLRHNEEGQFPKNEPRIVYDEIELKHLQFYDVVEIDSINEKSIKKFQRLAREQRKAAFHSNNDAGEIYRSFKSAIDNISYGGLVSVGFKNNRNQINDYLEFISVSFIKTSESFVVIRVDVTPSQLFLSKFKDIITVEVDSRGIVHYKSYWTILSKMKFISHQAMGTNSLSRGLDNLFYDMQYQVFRNVLQYINGVFSRSGQLKEIPFLSYFQIKNMEQFHKDKKLQSLFPRTFDGPFLSADCKTEIYLTELDKENEDNIRIVREISVDATPEHEKKYSQDLNLHFMLESFAFPCAFRAKLKLQIAELNLLKRDIYDFTEYISKRRWFYLLSFFKINSKYIRLKIRLTKFVTSMKRFESEFKPDNITFYLNEENLISFTATKPRKERENLLALYRSEFKYQSGKYHSSIKGIQEVFKSVEELNTFRTNLVLQIFSVVVAVMAIIFAFDKVKQMFNW